MSQLLKSTQVAGLFKALMKERGYRKHGAKYLLERSGASLVVTFFKRGGIFLGDDWPRMLVEDATHLNVQFDVVRLPVHWHLGMDLEVTKPDWGVGLKDSYSMTDKTVAGVGQEIIIRTPEDLEAHADTFQKEFLCHLERMEQFLDDRTFSKTIFEESTIEKCSRYVFRYHERLAALYLAYKYDLSFKRIFYEQQKEHIKNESDFIREHNIRIYYHVFEVIDREFGL